MNERAEHLRALLQDFGIDVLLVSPSADLLYLTGYAAHVTERPTLYAATADGENLMLVPELEAPRLAGDRQIRVLSYGDGEDPYHLLAEALLGHPARIALSDQTWAAVLLSLEAALPEALFVPASPLLSRLRRIKSPAELDLLARAASMADRVFEQVIAERFEGRTEEQVAGCINELLHAAGLERADWGPIVASGPNSASPHHLTGKRVIEAGDAVVLDYGGVLERYQADITRTVHVGPASREFVHVYEVVRQAQQGGIEVAAPGIPLQTIDRAARRIISAAGYGPFFIHRTGHGIGLECHEEPYILEGNELPVELGMTFSIEPGIYLPDRFGVRIEDIVAITEDGCIRLNGASRQLVEVV